MTVSWTSSVKGFTTNEKIQNIELVAGNIFSTAWRVSKYGVFSGLCSLLFRLNTEIYSVILRVLSRWEKIRTRKNSVFGYFLHSVSFTDPAEVSKFTKVKFMLVWCTDLLVLTTPIIIIVLIMIALEIIPIMIMSPFLDKVFKIFTSDKKLKCKLNIQQKR